MAAAHKLAAHGHGLVKKGGPSVTAEIVTGVVLGIAGVWSPRRVFICVVTLNWSRLPLLVLALTGASLWKMYHMNVKRTTADFYNSLEKGEITVLAAQE